MKRAKTILFFMLSINYGYAQADSDAEKEAERLLNIMHMETALKESVVQMLDIQLEQNPALIPFKPVLIEFFNKHMSYESLKPAMIKIYADAFTASELKEINTFYLTPTGAKSIRLMPELMAKGGRLGSKRVQDNIQELHQMIETESERLRELQESEQIHRPL